LATVRILRSTTAAATPSSLVSGQIAINEADGVLFYRSSAGVVTPFSSSASIPDGYVYDCGVFAAIAPAAPTGLTVTPGGSQAALAWTAPSSTGGAAITDYRIQYSFNSGSFTTFSRAASTSTSATITGLSAGSYVFRVAAINSVGTGADVTSSSTSISAVVSLLTITRDNGTSTFTVSGNGGNTFTRASGVEIGQLDGLSHYYWTAIGTATVTLSFNYSDDDYSGQSYSIIRTRSGSPSTIHTGTSANAITKTVSVISGDVVRITAGGDQSLQYFDNVSVSAA